MRTLNLANYAKLYESKKMGFLNETGGDKTKQAPATTPAPAAGPKNPAATNLTINTTDSEALKALKNCIRDMEPKDAYQAIENQSLLLANSTNQTAAQFSVKIADKDIKVVLRKLNGQVNGKTPIKPDFDAVGEVISGMDIDYVATKLHEAVDGIGTDEKAVAAIGGAVISYCYDKRVPPKEVWAAVSKVYQESYGETLVDAITDDFSGNAKVFAKGMFGGELTDDDFSGAGWGEFAKDPLLWAFAIIQVGSTVMSMGLLGPEWATLDAAALAAEAGAVTATEVGAGAAVTTDLVGIGATGLDVAKGTMTAGEIAAGGAEGASTVYKAVPLLTSGAETTELASAESSIMGEFIPFEEVSAAQSAAAGSTTAAAGAETTAIASESGGWLAKTGSNIVIKSKELASALAQSPQKVFSFFKNLAQKSPQAAKVLLSKLSTPVAQNIITGAALTEIGIDLVSVVNSGDGIISSNQIADEAQPDVKAATAVCKELHDEAKGWTSTAAELKIAATLFKLNPASWKLLNQIWNKYYGDTGESLYEYCINSELDGDLLTLVDGYIVGIGGPNPEAPNTSDRVAGYKGSLAITPKDREAMDMVKNQFSATKELFGIKENRGSKIISFNQFSRKGA